MPKINPTPEELLLKRCMKMGEEEGYIQCLLDTVEKYKNRIPVDVLEQMLNLAKSMNEEGKKQVL